MTRRNVLALIAFALLLLVNACPDNPLRPSVVPQPESSPTPSLPPSPSPVLVDDGVVVGAGDIANCDTNGAEKTARLLDTIPGIVITAGDNAYYTGSTLDYQRCYEPTWGRHKARTRPSPGNHEYETAGGAAYFGYFGENAGPFGRGFYSFTTGGWLVLSLNSSVDVTEQSEQMAWIRDALGRSPSRCTLAIFHHPPVASGPHGGSDEGLALWRTLVNAGVDVVMTGHEHVYERFAPLDERLQPSPTGARLFIVGTGGAPLSQMTRRSLGSEVQSVAWGVLKLTLRSESYDWSFIPVPGMPGLPDEGHDVCR